MALVRIQLRRDTAANWASANPVLANGEPGLETDTGKIKYGNGSQNWAALPYATNTPLSSTAPPSIGTAAAGSSASAARADHTHSLPSLLSVDSLQTKGDIAVGGNATISGTLSATKLSTSAAGIIDLTETVQDIVGDSMRAGDGIKVLYNDADGTITVSASGAGTSPTNPLTGEDIDDRVANLLVAGAGIELKYNDNVNTLTISAVSLDGGDVPSDTPPSATLSISAAPVNTEAEEDGLATFSVTAAGGKGTLRYQWEYLPAGQTAWQNVTNGSGTTGATTARLSIDGVAAALNKRWFRCAVTDDDRTVRSRAAQLRVNYFEITVQPVSTTAVTGSTTPSTTFSVTAVSDDAITYQWQSRSSGVWGNIAGATSATYGSISATANATYRCAVTSNGVTIYTNVVTLSVTSAPVTITAHPADATASSGAATFTATYTGGSSPTVRWQVQRAGLLTWEDIAGETTTTLSLSGLAGVDNGNKYRIVITNGTTSLASNAATLTVAGPAITIQPQDANASLGVASFTFAYSGGTGSVQWWRRTVGSTSWTAISGQTSTTLSLSGLLVTDSGREYSATVTLSGTTLRTRAALLTVSADVFFSSQPQSVTVGDGEEFTMTFNTSYGAGEVHYFQWQQLLPDSGAAWRPLQAIANSSATTVTIFPGQKHPTLTLRASVALNGAKYRAYLYKQSAFIPVDPLYSEVATLTVRQLPVIRMPAVLPLSRPYSMTVGGIYANSPTPLQNRLVRHGRMATFAYGSGRIIGVGHGGGIDVAAPSASSGGIFPLGPSALTIQQQDAWMDSLNRGTNIFIYSDDDGATWASGQFPVSAIWTDVAFSGGRFAAVGLAPGGSWYADQYSSGRPNKYGCDTVLCFSSDGGRTWTNRILHRGPQRIPRVIGSASSGFLITASDTIYASDGWNVVKVNDSDRPVDDGVRVGDAWATIGSRLNIPASVPLLSTPWIQPTPLEGRYQASIDDGINWRDVDETIDYADPTFGESQSVIASTGSAAVLVSSGGSHVYSTSDGFNWTYQPVYLSAVNSGGSVNTIAVRAVAAAGPDILYLAKNAYQVSSGAQQTTYEILFRAPASSPHLATPVFSGAVPAGVSVDGFQHVIATERYFVAIDTVSGGVLRIPLSVSDHVSDPPPTDGRPLAPLSANASPLSPTSISVSWAAPSSGGAPITSYVVQRSTDMGRTWTNVSTPSSSSVSVTVTGLTSGTNYLFRIAAVNSIGTGPYSYASNMTAPATIRPSAPRGVASVPTTHTASNARKPTFLVTWQAPEVDGGSPITGYEIQSRRQSIAADGTRGSFSDWVPLPPRGTSGVVRWSEVAGTRAVTADMQERPGVRLGVQHRVAATNANGLGSWAESNVVDWGTVGGTTGGTPAGPGTTSPPGSATSLSTALIANPLGDAGNPGFSLSWAAPTSGGTPSGYSVQTRKQVISGGVRGAFDAWETLGARNTSSPSDPAYRKWASVSGTTATVALSGMRPGTTYGFQFRVAATNEAGAGAYVEGSVVDWPTASSAPTVPQSVSASLINNTITGNATQPGFSVSWTAPSSAGSSAISSYVLQWRYRPLDTYGNAGEYGPWQALPARNTTDTNSPAYRTWATVSGTSATVSGGGFRSTLKYEFQIRVGALNSTGASPWGEASAVQWPAP